MRDIEKSHEADSLLFSDINFRYIEVTQLCVKVYHFQPLQLGPPNMFQGFVTGFPHFLLGFFSANLVKIP